MQFKKRIKQLIKRISKRKLTKIVYKITSPLISEIGIKLKIQKSKIDQKKGSIIIVSHDASITGAPKLALNISRVGDKYNIITIILRDGHCRRIYGYVSNIVITKIWNPNFRHDKKSIEQNTHKKTKLCDCQFNCFS